MAFAEGIGFLSSIFTQTSILNVSFYIHLVVVIFTLVLITRDYSKWKQLALIVMVGWHIAGLKTSMILLIPASFIFIVDLFSGIEIGKLLQTGKKTIKPLEEGFIGKYRPKLKKSAVGTKHGIPLSFLTNKQLESTRKRKTLMDSLRRLGRR